MTDDDAYERLHAQFRWYVPAHFNIADVCVRRWAADASRVAIIEERDDGHLARFSYAAIARDANRLANALRALGVVRGDRVALYLPQRAETAVAHLAIYQLGAIAVPLSTLFGADALTFRLEDSGAVAVICEAEQATTIGALCAGFAPPLLMIVVGADVPAAARIHGWDALLGRAADSFTTVETAADDPAVLIYTSGTTGMPKGALLPHRALIGNLPGFVSSQNWFPQSGDVFWSPADWAWTGGLMDALLPTLYFGFPIVALRARFSAERACALMVRHAVTNTFLFPTALKQIMKQIDAPCARYALRLRAIMSAGEPVGTAVFDWTSDALGVILNEMFGQTEVNYIVGNCGARWPVRAGSMGRAYPGHRVAVIDDDGRTLPDGEPGEIAIHRRDRHGDLDPIFFLGYWNNDAATRAKFSGDPRDSWWRTGDVALREPDGTLWYHGRADDMFKSAGYRIGPAEIENCLLKHPAVANAAVVPKPDADRGALVKAFVVLAPGQLGNAALIETLQAHVRERLAPYEYPKEIEFIDALPMTTTGKVQRRVLREIETQRAMARG